MKIEVYDSLFNLTILMYYVLVLTIKKCEDYIQACSVLQKLTIVSIHQRRIIDNYGRFDGGLQEDID